MTKDTGLILSDCLFLTTRPYVDQRFVIGSLTTMLLPSLSSSLDCLPFFSAILICFCILIFTRSSLLTVLINLGALLRHLIEDELSSGDMWLFNLKVFVSSHSFLTGPFTFFSISFRERIPFSTRPAAELW